MAPYSNSKTYTEGSKLGQSKKVCEFSQEGCGPLKGAESWEALFRADHSAMSVGHGGA